MLATGHISPQESRSVVDSARIIGVRKIVITHPEYWVVDMSIAQQEELITDYHVVLERCFRQPLPNGQWGSNVARNAEAIRQLGADNTILSTDCGDPADPPWEYAMAQYLHEMEAHGVSRDALRRMTHTLPAQLLGLEDAAEQHTRIDANARCSYEKRCVKEGNALHAPLALYHASFLEFSS